MKKVRAGTVYRYQPVVLDLIHPPHGVAAGLLSEGALVRVVKLPGAPPPNTMGHAHIQDLNGVFLGLVHVNSLQPERGN